MSPVPTDAEPFTQGLSPTYEHFLKKQLLHTRLAHELHSLSHPDCLKQFGAPFKTDDSIDKEVANDEYPLLGFFFRNFVTQFPLILCNSPEKQQQFWQDTVQPFVESFNSKSISDSGARKNGSTKRHKANNKVLSGVLLFFNSMLITEKELTYLNSDHLKSAGTSKLDKLGANVSAGADKPSLKRGLNPFTQGSNSNSISINIVAVRKLTYESPTWKLWMSHQPTHHYEFIIQVVRPKDVSAPVNSEVISHFVARKYRSFKALANSLKAEYPGLMGTSIPKLPKKLAQDDGQQLKNGDGDFDEILHREKLRLALRGYLNALLRFPEIAHSDTMTKFLETDSFNELSPEEEQDSKQRKNHEQEMLKTQLEFHKEASSLILELNKQFEDFKHKLVTETGALPKVFQELGASQSTQDLSPMLRTFFEWGKLEIAATIYQMFLSDDGASESLMKVRKFNSLFPYTVVYGILKFTNPIKIISRMIDLLFVPIPGSNNNNLLSMIFVMILDEDLSGFDQEIELLEKKLADPCYQVLLKRIKNYVSDPDLQQLIQEDADLHGRDLLYTIFISDKLEPPLQDIELRESLDKSYKAYQLIGSQITLNEKKEMLQQADLYITLKQYWQVQTRKRDKDIMLQLWKEPELTQLLKQFLTIFYQPMMQVVGKCDIHLVFRDMQYFIDDLLDTMQKLSDGDIYFKSSLEVFKILKNLLDKHEVVFWRFIRDIYNKDNEGIFQGIINWIDKFLIVLRLKFTNKDMVMINIDELATKVEIDKNLFDKQLKALVEMTTEKRKLYKEYLNAKATLKDAQTVPGSQNEINHKWEKTNEQVFEGDSPFGINMEDINELNIEFENHNKMENGEFDQQASMDKELSSKVRKLEEAQRNIGTSEIDKFDDALKIQLNQLLNGKNLVDQIYNLSL